jgi:uncharacterized protein
VTVLHGLLALALAAGFAKLTAVVVNWFEAHPLHRFVFLLTKLSGVAAFPIGLVWFGLGLCTTQLSGPDLRFQWGASFVAAIIGLAWLLADAIRFHRYRPPACISDDRSIRHDLHAEVGPQVQGRHRSGWMLNLPGNQQFLLDCVEFTAHLPDLPAAWDGVTIAHFSDSHFRGAVSEHWFAAVADHIAAGKPDLIVFSGDLLDDPRTRAWIPATFGKLSAPWGCWYILGNHDWQQEPEASRAALEEAGWQPLAGRVVELRREGTGLLLAGSEVPWMPPRPDISSLPPGGFRILVSHSPDEIDWARRHGFQLMFAGHTHGGQIRLPLLGPVFSPSRYGVRFSAGKFLVDPTLLIVSRGLSGRDPLRYGCPPQISRVTLRRRERSEKR